jgi:hypothetical protein
MSKAQNEIEEFIYKICYRPIWESLNNYIAAHPTTLNFSMSRIKYPDTAMLLDMLLEYATHIRIDEDSLFFDAILSCTIELQQFDEYRGDMSGETSQWLIASCEAVITDRLESLTVSSVKPWSKDTKPSSTGVAASKSIVPIIYRKDLDKEATAFLEKYYPEALEEPLRIPIEEIAKEKLGLNVIQGYRITDDFTIFGQICFSPGTVKIYDLFKTSEKEQEVSRGTILIDAYTYWQRNSGCVNNTIAHEVYHWHRHRLYAAIKHILRNEKFIACRCPAEMSYPDEKEEWTDEQRMEWQANNLAPRILMPIQTFKIKVDELYKQYDYENTPLKLAVLTCIADDLASFYGVSRQSALIRMTETGYMEAKSVLQAINEKDWHSYVSREDVFYEYSTNEDFRKLLDSGKFRYVDGYVVINDEKYITTDDKGKATLSEYAWDNLDECTLSFSWQRIRRSKAKEVLPQIIFHRDNDEQDVSKYDSKQNASVIQLSEQMQKERRRFEQNEKIHRLSITDKNCWSYIYEIITIKVTSKPHFCDLTGLGEENYRKAEKGQKNDPTVRTIVAIGVGLKLDIETVEKMLTLAGRSFKDSPEDRALKFCITGLSGHPIEDCNDFLESLGYEPLGTKERN